MTDDSPNFFTFNPKLIPWQYQVVYDIEKTLDFSKGPHKILLSGSLASAKSTLMAWLIVRHMTKHPGARVLLARKTLPDLKQTIFLKVMEMLDGAFVEGRDYTAYSPVARIKMRNGSECFARTWHDGKFKKFRSLDLSMIALEELTENDQDDFEAYREMTLRLGRVRHIKESYFISATNPGDPESWQYKEFLGKENSDPFTHVYYSLTEQNPFLPEGYIDHVKRTTSPEELERLLYGKWVSINKENIYYAYDSKVHLIDSHYAFDKKYYVDITFDFNIGAGKPMSCCVAQCVRDDKVGWVFSAAKTFIIHGFRTLDILEEMLGDGIFKPEFHYRIFGDAAGKHRDTRSTRSDYDLIESFLTKHNVKFMMKVPLSNPPIRKRQNTVNAWLRNGLDETRTKIYKDAHKLGEGLKGTKALSGAKFGEDDSFELQHVVSAWGYYLTALEFELTIKNKSGNF